LDAAREEVRCKAASIARGANPSVERKAKRTAGTVLQLIESYLLEVRDRLRPRSCRETERNLRKHSASLHHERIEAVHRREISAMLERISKKSGPIAANRVRAALSALWTWGLKTGRIDGDANPVAFTIRNPEKACERTLNDAEIRAIWNATNSCQDYARIVRLCLLTGCRREEIAGLRWSEVLADKVAIGANRMKGKLPHEFPMLPMIQANLPSRPESADGCIFGRQKTGFSGFSDSKEKLDANLRKSGQTAPWRLHDLRRTFSTRLHDAGIDPIVIEALLAHKQQGVAAVYNRASFREAKLKALTRWHEIVGEVVEERIDPTTQMEAVDPESAAAPQDLDFHELRNMTASGKREHLGEQVFRALEVAGRENRDRGQPPRVDEFREVWRLADQLEAQGVPFGVSSTSIMNRRVRDLLNEQAARSHDTRKSRRKQITPAAVRKWLRDVRSLRYLCDHFTKMHPYTD
jgi:integrase